jgi:hypothetical protein
MFKGQNKLGDFAAFEKALFEVVHRNCHKPESIACDF